MNAQYKGQEINRAYIMQVVGVVVIILIVSYVSWKFIETRAQKILVKCNKKQVIAGMFMAMFALAGIIFLSTWTAEDPYAYVALESQIDAGKIDSMDIVQKPMNITMTQAEYHNTGHNQKCLVVPWSYSKHLNQCLVYENNANINNHQYGVLNNKNILPKYMLISEPFSGNMLANELRQSARNLINRKHCGIYCHSSMKCALDYHPQE